MKYKIYRCDCCDEDTPCFLVSCQDKPEVCISPYCSAASINSVNWKEIEDTKEIDEVLE